MELTDKEKIKRGYAGIIDNYAAKALKPLFDKHFSKVANIKAEHETAYKTIAKDYKIEQEKSITGKNFK